MSDLKKKLGQGVKTFGAGARSYCCMMGKKRRRHDSDMTLFLLIGVSRFADWLVPQNWNKATGDVMAVYSFPDNLFRVL